MTRVALEASWRVAVLCALVVIAVQAIRLGPAFQRIGSRPTGLGAISAEPVAVRIVGPVDVGGIAGAIDVREILKPIEVVGPIEVSGRVDVSQPIRVTGKVEVDGPVKLAEPVKIHEPVQVLPIR